MVKYHWSNDNRRRQMSISKSQMAMEESKGISHLGKGQMPNGKCQRLKGNDQRSNGSCQRAIIFRQLPKVNMLSSNGKGKSFSGKMSMGKSQ